MESLDTLRNFIKSVDYNDEEASFESHKAIYRFVNETVLSPDSPLTKHVPSLDIIVYGIKRHLYPEPILDGIPDLLDLLATAEWYRQKTLSAAQNALVWNTYYKNKPKFTLTADDQKVLNEFEAKKESWRKMYLTILLSLCKNDIYLMWTEKPPCITEFMIRFNEYFPSLNDPTAQSPRLFHSSLSEEEKVLVEQAGRECCQRIQDSCQWAVRHREDGETLVVVFKTKAFQKAYPIPCAMEPLRKLFDIYLNHIQTSTRKLHDMFD
ncbi:hypothetical protein BDN72DRAFT_832343 [Pluteus cervinus]|uniref:Uncharacterized protein n=1 Tax=Pluteus cervinus TaxID=181527 RepID=A0ACD3BC92_9AGAR|nr:hypothetical protein BDN72DRAFT_832343 [Pluteus cervinus]